MNLSYVLHETASDLAYLSQISTAIVKQSRSIKRKADNAVASGMSTAQLVLDGAFFLSRELYDIDAEFFFSNAYLSQNLTRLTRLLGTSNYPGPFYRRWLPTVTAVHAYNAVVSGVIVPPATIDGSTVTDGSRYLLINQADPKFNGIYYKSSTAFSPTDEDFLFAAVKATATPSGHRFGLTHWWNKANMMHGVYGASDWVMLKEVQGITGSSTDSSHQINSINYYTVVANLTTPFATLISTANAFYAAINALKGCTTLTAVLTACVDVEVAKTNLNSAIAAFDTPIKQLEDFNFYHESHVPSIGTPLTESEKGFQTKPNKLFAVSVAQALQEKTYNNNYSKSQGDGSGGTSTAGGSMTGNAGSAANELIKIGNNTNSITEYWAQIGWMSAERATNYKSYVELMERDIKERGLEEIVDMHDKAVKDTYEREKLLPQGFLNTTTTTDGVTVNNVSPKPLTKNKRARRDKTLSYTETELENL